MRKHIQKQLYRMTFVVVMMIALALWQHQFVITAINSNIFLNATIIGTFVFGLGLIFKYQFDLCNEITAFEALQEKYNDILRRDEDETDPFWRFRRCSEPAIIFSPPRIMWQAYFLISDEMSRTGDLKISAGTMQTLVDGIDTKLDDQKSLSSYITGLLVFLGLIGTFVGLMVTLASVGKIIGDLDLSGGGGTEVIQKLMNNLKTPLQGMAPGFSSSLFGLITSLALGLIGRFQNLAASSLKLEFEAWLSSVVHITDDVDGGDAGVVARGGGPGIDMQHLRLMYNVARYSLTASHRTNRILDRLTSAVNGLAEEQSKQGTATLQLSGNLEKTAQYQGAVSWHLGRTAKALSRYEELALAESARTGSMLGTMTEKIADLAAEQSKQGQLTGKLADQVAENARYQSLVTHHLGRTAKALESHDDMALKLREMEAGLNTRIDDLAGLIDRSTGNIESLTEEIIRLGEQEENALDREYQRMMKEIDTTIREEQQSGGVGKGQVMEDQAVAVNAGPSVPQGSPAAAPVASPARSHTGPADPVNAMREKLADAWRADRDEEI